MIGVVVVPGPSPAMHGLDADRSLALLPLGDRPALQHIVESLVAQGILRIEFIVGHAPQRVEALFGNGDRWGSRFRYHLAADPERPYRSLRVISEIKSESWLLLHAERFPIVDFEAARRQETTLYYEADETILSTESSEDPQGSLHWGGAARFPLGTGIDDFANLTPKELVRYFEDRAMDGSATVIATARWIDTATPANLLLSQTKLLNQRLKGLTISGLEIQPNVWVSRNTILHPDVTLNAPVYIGPNTRISHGVTLGPNTVIGSNCFIDANTSIEDTLVLMGTYIGQSLELKYTIVARSLLVNVRLDTILDIEENFLLGRVAQSDQRNPIRSLIRSVAALLLFVLFFPIFFLSLAWFLFVKGIALTSVTIETASISERLSTERPASDSQDSDGAYELPCLGADAWDTPRKAGWSAFTRQFLPGLIAVFFGEIGFVGLPPRTRAAIDNLTPEWRDLYTNNQLGLITEASITSADRSDAMQLYLADAYYDVQHSWQHDLKLTLRYFAALILPRP